MAKFESEKFNVPVLIENRSDLVRARVEKWRGQVAKAVAVCIPRPVYFARQDIIDVVKKVLRDHGA